MSDTHPSVEEILTRLVNCAKHEDDDEQQFTDECITKQQALAAINALRRADMEYIGKEFMDAGDNDLLQHAITERLNGTGGSDE